MNVGELKLSLLLDIKPFGESVKAAMNILTLFGKSAKDALNFQPPTVSTSEIDSEVKKLETTLSNYSKNTEDAAENTDELQKVFNTGSTASVTFSDKMQNLYLRFMGIQSAVSVLKNSLGQFLGEFNRMQSAMLGLESISVFKGVDTAAAKDALNNLGLVKNGLLSVSDASTSLKNLLASNFTLEQSVELLQRLGDSAAFGRQESLSFGQAVRSATEGIKNGNSILVDNAGVTKNLSVMLEEAGFKAQDLSRAGQDAGVRMAIFNGIMGETTGQLGNASKLMQSSQGSLVRFEKSINDLKIAFGSILSAIVPLITGPISKVAELIANANANVKIAALSVGTLAAAFILLNGAIPMPLKLLSVFSAVVIALPTPWKVLIGVISIATVAIIALNGGLATTNVLLGGIPMLIGLLVTGITALTSSYYDLAGASEEFNATLNESATAIDSQTASLKDLQTVQDALNNGMVLTSDQQEEYAVALDNVKSQFPQVIAAIDSKTNKESIHRDVLEEVIAKEREKLKIQKDAEVNVLTAQLSDLTQEYIGQADAVESLNTKLSNGAEILKNEFKWDLNPFATFQDQLRNTSDELIKTSAAAQKTKDNIVALFLTAVRRNNLSEVLRQFKESLGQSRQATELLNDSVNAMISSIIQGFYDAGLAGQSLAQILKIIAVAQTYIKVGQEMNSEAMVKRGEVMLSQINTYLDRIKSAKSFQDSVNTKSEGSDKTTGKDQTENSKDALQLYNEKLEETKSKIAEIKELLAKPGLRPDELEYLLGELSRLSAELEKLKGGVGVNPATISGPDTKIEPVEYKAPEETKTNEIFQQSLSLASQISSVLGIGAKTFAGELLNGLQQGLSLANSFASLLSLVLKVGSGGIFSLLGFASGGSVPGAGSGDTVPAMLTPGEFVVRKSVVQKLGTGFFEWINGGGMLSSMVNKYATGGLVTASAQAPAQVYLINSRVKGNDIELALKRTTKINSRRLT